MKLSSKAKLVLSLFNDNIGGNLSREDIINATNWGGATVDTYINKKWVNLVLEPLGNDNYKVILTSIMAEDEFYDLQTQVHQLVRTQ
ncbi:hypothetical protein [Shewanella oncorhynchi]|uniref:hypothetical protein n=1 Tax=Shewanella oncorhynchi TaxID=2726434 RepID=UPI003D7B4B0E